MSDLLTFDECRVGDKWTSPARRVSEQDVMQFAYLTGDFDPLHVAGGKSSYGQPIAHGLLGLSLVAGLGGDYPRAATVALISVRDWQFLGPIYFGDTVHAETVVAAKRRDERQQGLITWKRRLLNQRGEVVQQGVFETLVADAVEHPSAASSAVNP
jgi:acyl dehydratase